MADEGKLRVLSCRQCQGPVMQDAHSCMACGTPVNGKEFPYIMQQAASPDIRGLLKWWGIWAALVWAGAGFSFGVTSSLLFTGVSAIYLFRILRAYYR